MKNITKNNFKDEIETHEGLIVIDLWAAWCGPCRMLSPVLDEVEAEYPDVLRIIPSLIFRWALFLKQILKSLLSSINNMKIRYNEDEEVVKAVKEGLERTGGYCPCRRERTEENKCMCREFREQIKDKDFEGYCHCYLYYKEK